MVQIFRFPNINDTQTFFDYTGYANEVTGGIFIPLFVWIVFIITFIASKNFETSKAFTIASFIAVVIVIPLTVVNLVSSRFMYIFIIFLGVGMVWLKLETGRIA